MSTLPRLSTRYHNRIELTFRDPVSVTQYRVSGHKSLDGAQTAPVAMFTVTRGTQFRSPYIVSNKWGLIDESMRGLSKATFDLNDYQPLSANLPTDNLTAYLRIEDEVGGVWQPYTPILVIPPADFYGTNSPSFTLSGNAPGITAIAGDPPPAASMFIALPRTAATVEVHNNNAVGGAQLMVSFGEGMGMAPVLPVQYSTSYGPVSFIALASGDGNPAPFSIFCSMDRF